MTPDLNRIAPKDCKEVVLAIARAVAVHGSPGDVLTAEMRALGVDLRGVPLAETTAVLLMAACELLVEGCPQLVFAVNQSEEDDDV